MVAEIFSRNIGTITEKEHFRLAKSTVGIVGMGGIGSPAFEALVRAGVGKFVIFDRDRFEKTNFNRQIYSTKETLGKRKADVAAGKGVSINPGVKIRKYAETLDGKTVRKLESCDVVVDGTDNIAARSIIANFCRKGRIPYVFCSAGKAQGMVSVFAGADFDAIFGNSVDSEKKSVIAPAAMAAGALSASQALAVLLGRQYVKAPEFLFFDLFSDRVFWKHKI